MRLARALPHDPLERSARKPSLPYDGNNNGQHKKCQPGSSSNEGRLRRLEPQCYDHPQANDNVSKIPGECHLAGRDERLPESRWPGVHNPYTKADYRNASRSARHYKQWQRRHRFSADESMNRLRIKVGPAWQSGLEQPRNALAHQRDRS